MERDSRKAIDGEGFEWEVTSSKRRFGDGFAG